MARKNGNKSYKALLIEAYGDVEFSLKENIPIASELTISPLSFMFAGYYQGNSRNGRGSYGDYWTKSPNGGGSTFILEFTRKALNTMTSYSRWAFSNPFRCVAKSPPLFLNKARNFSPTNFLCYNILNCKGH